MNKKIIEAVVVFLLALATGLIFYYPNYKIEKDVLQNKIISNKFVYSTISSAPLSSVHDELAYAELVRAEKDGVKNIGDINIYENRNKVNPTNNVSFIIAGYLSKLFGSVNSFFKFADFIFPFLSIIIGYFFLRMFLQNRLIAAWGVVILLSMFSFGALFNILLFRFKECFAHSNNFSVAFNVFALKYPSFQLVFPFTFLFYYFCYKLLVKNSNLYLVVTALLAGLSSYIYLDSFLTFGLQLIFLMVWAFIQNKRSLAFRFLIAGILALLLNSSYILDVLAYMSEPGYIFKAMAVVLTKSVDYDIYKTSLKFLFVIALLFFLFRRIRSVGGNVCFILSILVPTFFLMALSTIIFFIPHTQHLNTFEARNVVIIALLLISSTLLRKENLQNIIAQKYLNLFHVNIGFGCCAKYVLIIFIILNSAQIMAAESYYLYNHALLHYPKYTIERDVVKAHEWLDENAPKDSVVLTIDESEINMLPIFTGLYVYIPDAYLTESPVDEIWSRVKQGFGFYGVNKTRFEGFLREYQYAHFDTALDLVPRNDFDIEKYENALFKYKESGFHNVAFSGKFLFDSRSLSFEYYRKYFTEEELKRIYDNEKGRRYYQGIYFIPNNLIMEQVSNYTAGLGNIELLKYKVDYVWLGPYEKKFANINNINSKELKTVYDNNLVTIYKIVK